MLTDLLIPPGIFSLYLLANTTLLSLNINNKFVLLVFVYLFCHLFFSILMFCQLYSLKCYDGDVKDKMNYSTFVAVLISMLVVLFYIFSGITPFFRYFVYPLTFLPKANIWIDHLVVSIPAIIAHKIARYIIKKSLACP